MSGVQNTILLGIGSVAELRTQNYHGFAWIFDPNPMGPLPDPKTTKTNMI